MRFYRDEKGYTKAELPRDLLYLSRFLETEIGGVKSRCLEMIDAIKETVSKGGDAIWEWAGDSYEIAIHPAFVEIKCIWNEDVVPLRLPIDKFSVVLVEWLVFLRTENAQ